MYDIVLLLAVAGISLVVGDWVLTRLRVEFATVLERFLFSTGIGLALLMYFSICLGFLGLLYSLLYASVFLLLGVGLFGFVKRWWHEAMSLIRALRPWDMSTLETLLFGLLAVHVVMVFLCALAPAEGWDTLVYHLPVPKFFAMEHRICDLPYVMHSYTPLNFEMLFLVKFLFNGGEAFCQLLHWFTSVLCMLLVYSFTKKFIGREAGLIAASIFYITPLTDAFAADTLNDFCLCLFTFLAFYSFCLWYLEGEMRQFAVSCVFCGMALGTKWTGAFTLIILSLFVFYKLCVIDKSSWYKGVWKVVGFGLLAGAVGSPWYIRSALLTGNPCFPHLHDIFGCGQLDPYYMELFHLNVEGFGAYRIQDFLFLPWTLTMPEYNFINCGPLLLAYVPFVFLTKRTPVVNLALVFALLFLIMSRFIYSGTRLIIPSLPFLAFVAAYSIKYLSENNPSLRKIIPFTLFLVFFFNMGYHVRLSHTGERFAAGAGIISKSDYLRKWVDNYDALSFVNTNLPESARVMFFFDQRIYYCDRDVFVLNPMSQNELNPRTLKDFPEFLGKLRGLRITHLVINNNFPEAIKGEYYQTCVRHWQKFFDELLNSRAKKIYSEGGIEVYELDI